MKQTTTLSPHYSIKTMTATGVMAAAVYAASMFLQIPIPTAIGTTRLHMGNVCCLLAGILLGPVQGGLAAGIGSMLFDLTSPAYAASAPFTFIFKYLMAWICGKICHSHQTSDALKSSTLRRRFITGTAAGSALYLLLYLSKSFIGEYLFLHLPLQAVLLTTLQKAAVSATNACFSILCAVPLGLILKKRTTFLLDNKKITS